MGSWGSFAYGRANSNYSLSLSLSKVFLRQSKVISEHLLQCVELGDVKVGWVTIIPEVYSGKQTRLLTGHGGLIPLYFTFGKCSLITSVTYNKNTVLTIFLFIAKGRSAWEQFATHIKFILCLCSWIVYKFSAVQVFIPITSSHCKYKHTSYRWTMERSCKYFFWVYLPSSFGNAQGTMP